MNRSLRHWLIIASTALTIGSGVAIAEKSLIKAIDSLLPDSRRIASFNRPGTITLLSRNGEVIQKIGPATREKIESMKMPTLIEQAFVAAEDRRFYKHKGVDIWGISRAISTNLRKGSVQEGASTITQQLARTVFLSQDQTLTRKIKEAALAYKLERQLSKQNILEQYLNNVYLGSGAYGVADAAWVYFSKTPKLLSLAEAALIAGLPPAPSFYSPLVNPELAIKRRSIVLQRMYEEGYISKTEFSNSVKSPLLLKPALPKYFKSVAPFFTTWAEKQLPAYLTKEQLEVGGLKIRTSLNLSWQKEAQEIIKKLSPEGTEGSLVSIHPKTGLIRAMIGGKDFNETQFNRATQALRSPGSTFKLFPYAAALAKGYKPEDRFLDSPKCWEGYCPKNFGNKYLGEVSLADAMTKSLNTVAVQLLEQVGFDQVISIANKLGVGNQQKLGKYYPLAIGAYEQTLLDMTGAYAGITNRGKYIRPSPFEEIRGPNDILLFKNQTSIDEGVQAVSKDVADTLNWMLKRVVSEGTGKFAGLKDREVSGKTGTSEGGRDLWFIGSIPQLSTGIWFGYDDNKKTNNGSRRAAEAWKEYMNRIKGDIEPKKFPERPLTSYRKKFNDKESNLKLNKLRSTEQSSIERSNKILNLNQQNDLTRPPIIKKTPIYLE